jgi:flagellar motor protein MotB
MKKSVTSLACAALLAFSLSTLTAETNAQASPQFDSPAAAAPKLQKKKANAKPSAKVKSSASVKAKAKASGKAKKSKKSSHAKKAKAHKVM